MSAEPPIAPLQLLVVGFETTAGFRGDIARELRDLRGRGMVRVLDARLFHRAEDDGRLTEIDLNPLLADPPTQSGGALAHLLGVNGAGATAIGLRPRRWRGRPASRSRTFAG